MKLQREPPGARTVTAACPVCRAESSAPYWENMYRIGEVHFHLVRCPCGMVYVNPRPDDETLAWMYADPDYYHEGYTLGVETEGYFSRREELLELYGDMMAELERELGAPGRLMELGSAGGFLLEAARRRGWHVRGVEVSAPAVAYARDELGLEIFAGELKNAPYPEGSFDLVIADNVLEHTTDPAGVLEQLWRLLPAGGHLLVIVPSYVNSPYFRLLGRAKRLLPARLLGERLLRILKMDPEHDGGHPYHLLEFDRRRILRALGQAGFEIRSAQSSLPMPAHLFKTDTRSLRLLALRGVFRALDTLMRLGLAPGARTRVLARRPAESPH